MRHRGTLDHFQGDEMNTYQQAESARDNGMAISEANANRAKIRWSEDADSTLALYCHAHKGTEFLTETVREWGESMGFVDPVPTAKAWGGVMRRAAANGIIKKVGYAPSKSSNLSPKTLWTTA